MMKFLSVLAAASLALSPAIAMAGSDQAPANSRPIAGPTAVKPLDDDKLPAAALSIATLAILGAGVMALTGGNDPNNSGAATTTNETPNPD